MSFKKVGAFWKAKSGKGYSGVTDTDIPEGSRLYIGKNQYKEDGDKKPDLVLSLIVEDEKPEEDSTPF